ncbi:MAG: HPr family phosphocarrier protein [Gammaproteobacteria bacterium]
MAERLVRIANKLGLHARAAARFVQLAASFQCEIKVARSGREVNGKSIMGVMMLAAGQGSEIQIKTAGADEEEALQSLAELVMSRFGEAQ